jgi:hypothetical protein
MAGRKPLVAIREGKKAMSRLSVGADQAHDRR